MRLLFIIYLLFATNAFAGNDNIRSVEKTTFSGTVIDIEKPYTFIVNTTLNDVLNDILIMNEIPKTNFVKREVNGNTEVLLKVIIQGIGKESSRGEIRRLFKGKDIDFNCESVLLKTYSGRLLACHALLNNEDLPIIAYANGSSNKSVVISTWAINTEVPLSKHFKKIKTNLLLSTF